MDTDSHPQVCMDIHRHLFFNHTFTFSWLFPFIGHMGIGTSTGIIRDFAGPYYVSEDNMAFGKPTKYYKLNPSKAENGKLGFDRAIEESAQCYSQKMVIY